MLVAAAVVRREGFDDEVEAIVLLSVGRSVDCSHLHGRSR